MENISGWRVEAEVEMGQLRTWVVGLLMYVNGGGEVMRDNSSGHDLEREEFEKMIGKGLGRGLEEKSAEGLYIFGEVSPYTTWPMGRNTTVRPMTHGKIFHRTPHDPWVDLPLYGP